MDDSFRTEKTPVGSSALDTPTSPTTYYLDGLGIQASHCSNKIPKLANYKL